MTFLILTQYFPPETGAPQNRLFELAVRLQALGHSVHVLTAMPNYPHMRIQPEYRGRMFMEEEMSGLRVMRSFIFVSKSSHILFRLLNYFSFVFSSLLRGLFLRSRYDFVMCESPPLFLGITAMILSKLKGWRLIFNVSDLWPESAEKLGIVTNKPLLAMAYSLESWCYKSSVLVTGQTQGIVQDIKTRFPKVSAYWLPNGVDLSLYDPSKKWSDWRSQNGFSQKDVLMLYAGIIGHAQGLEVILDAAEILRFESRLKFVIMGEGPEKDKLRSIADQRKLSNVYFFAGVSKSEIGSVVAGADAAITPLRNLPLFKGAIPSKIFETLALEKPIFLGVDGEARELFIDEGQCGWYFEPENSYMLAEKIKDALANPEEMNIRGKNGRTFVDRKFNRNNIALEFDLRLKQL